MKKVVRNFTLLVVGGTYRTKAVTRKLMAAELLHHPLKVRFEHEPDNEVDEYALKVVLEEWSPDLHIGYVARPMNTPLVKLLQAGAKVRSAELDYYDFENGSGEIELSLLVDNLPSKM